MQFRLCSECDGGSCKNGAFNNTVGPNGGSSAESPKDVLRFGPILQDEIGVRSSNQGPASYEEKLGVGFILTVQSDHSAKFSHTVGDRLETGCERRTRAGMTGDK